MATYKEKLKQEVIEKKESKPDYTPSITSAYDRDFPMERAFFSLKRHNRETGTHYEKSREEQIKENEKNLEVVQELNKAFKQFGEQEKKRYLIWTTSWNRTPAKNRQVGGKSRSQHLWGKHGAGDFQLKNVDGSFVSPDEVRRAYTHLLNYAKMSGRGAVGTYKSKGNLFHYDLRPLKDGYPRTWGHQHIGADTPIWKTKKYKDDKNKQYTDQMDLLKRGHSDKLLNIFKTKHYNKGE